MGLTRNNVTTQQLTWMWKPCYKVPTELLNFFELAWLALLGYHYRITQNIRKYLAFYLLYIFRYFNCVIEIAVPLRAV